MAGEQIRMPASTGGLVRYYEEYKSKFQFKPEVVIVLIVVVLAFEVFIRLF